MIRSTLIVAHVLVFSMACSADSGRPLQVGHEPDDEGPGGSAGFRGSRPGQGGDGGLGTGSEALSVRVRDPDAMTLEVITLACAGDCADIEAVARGGNPPYDFEWEDGSTSAKRRVCLDASTKLTVRATDTAITDDEFSYEAQTVAASVTATVLDCMGEADASVPQSNCGPGATPPYLAVAKQPSTSTLTWTQTNGNLADYAATSLGGGPLAIVGKAERTIELGSCTKLLLAGNAEGTEPVGWDDSMIVEYRSAPGGPVEKRWYYGTLTLTYTPDNQALASKAAPTVAGTSLDPPVPNPLPYGFEPLAIDLMKEVPAGAEGFDITIYVLDAGNVGSTTEVWVIPR